MVALRTIQKSPWRPDDINQYKDLLTGVLQGQALTVKTAADITAPTFTLHALDTVNGRAFKILKPDGSTGLLWDVNGLAVTGNVSITGTTSFQGGPVFNVKAYGADNTGVTAADAIVANVINDMPSTGGTLYFPAGTYKFDAPITISKKMTVMGDGPVATVITSTLANGNVINVTAPASSYNVFRDFAISKTVTATGGAGIKFSAPAGTSASEPRMINLIFVSQYIGVDALNTANPRFIGCSFTNAVNAEIRFDFDYSPFGAGDALISSCMFASATIGTTAAIRINGGAGYLIENSKFIGYGNPILLDISAGYANLTDLIVIGNSIEGQPTTPVLVNMQGASDFANIIIANNQMVINGTGTAINLAASAGVLSKIKVSGNLIECNDTSTAMGFADGDDIYISDNDISGAAGATAFVNSGATNIRRGLNNVVGVGTLQTGTWTFIQPRIQTKRVAMTATNAALGGLFKGPASAAQSWPDPFLTTPHTVLYSGVTEGALQAVIDTLSATQFTAHAVGAATGTAYTFDITGLSDG